MKKAALIILAVLVLLAVVAGGWYVGTRNDLVRLDETVEGQWGQVQTVYQRRLDLIPNLVETVKGYAAHERETLEAVTNARASASMVVNLPAEALQDPEAMRRFEQSQQQLSGALQRLLALREAYPDLKANENFLNLQAQLEGTENRIAVERRRYNETVQAYNSRVRQFPANLVAASAGFDKRPYFQAQPGAEQAPPVRF